MANNHEWHGDGTEVEEAKEKVMEMQGRKTEKGLKRNNGSSDGGRGSKWRKS